MTDKPIRRYRVRLDVAIWIEAKGRHAAGEAAQLALASAIEAHMPDVKYDATWTYAVDRT